jgi:hypothetical protein
MSIVKRWSAVTATAFCATFLVTPASADELLNTGTPGGFLGYYGFDVFVGQSVAIAFTPTQDYSFESVSLWLMSNSGTPGATMRISLQTDAGGGATPVAPSGNALETWAHATATAGWSPLLETMTSLSNPLLSSNTAYWIVAESSTAAGEDPIWVVAGNGPQYTMGTIDFASSPDWQVGLTGGAVGAIVNASPVPEPGALLLGLLGAPWVMAAARRRSAAARQPALASLS